ncbi:Uncharacterised protein [Mycobacterium tuberculosis]|nr:Uncharacterised protein [Mycobacterium tuberculosis]
MARQAWLGGRQTQNPERGRKHVRRRRKCPTARVVRPKTPRGDGNAPWMADALCAQVSSDPKPREGTETDPKPREGTETFLTTCAGLAGLGDGNAPWMADALCAQVSSDPKPREGTETFRRQFVDHEFSQGTETPRGWRMRCARKCRQTQNPERGRKQHLSSTSYADQSSGDGNAPWMADALCAQVSSDPKPREGTETIEGRRLWITLP